MKSFVHAVIGLSVCLWSTCAYSQVGVGILIRTAIRDHAICGLTGNALKLDDSWPRPIRAWAGFVVSEDGGPALKTIQERNRAWVKQILLQQDSRTLAKDNPDLNAELNARFRHCRAIKPRFFDAVLVEFAEPLASTHRFCWIVDHDIDGNLSDEAQHFVRGPPDVDPSDPALTNALFIERRNGFSFFRDYLVAPEDGANDQPQNPATINEDRPLPPLPELLAGMRATLHSLDTAATRKQHLEEVVAAADAMIAAIKPLPSGGPLHETLVDALYRKGRALGYMELPDVVPVKPVNDPVALNAQFEETFLQLDALVDSTAPEYILLRIRRERRRDRRGIALELVDTYRKTHPNPVWHFKKRFDLLTELGAKLHAHQAAADMWLHAEKPRSVGLLPVSNRTRGRC